MYKLLNVFAKSSAFDVLGGLGAGVGINLITTLYVAKPDDIKLLPSNLWWIAIGFIVSGSIISISRIILGSIRERSLLIARTHDEYLATFKNECDIIGILAGMTLVLGLMIAIYLILIMKR